MGARLTQEVGGVLPHSVQVVHPGEPLVTHLVGEDVEGGRETRVAGVDAQRGTRVPGESSHVDVRLQPARAPEERTVVGDELVDALHVVADEVVERRCVARVELEVRENNQKVVVVPVGLVEPLGHGGPRSVVGDSAGDFHVVVGAVPLDDGDRSHVPGDPGPGIGERWSRRNLARGGRAVGAGGCDQQERFISRSPRAADPRRAEKTEWPRLANEARQRFHAPRSEPRPGSSPVPGHP